MAELNNEDDGTRKFKMDDFVWAKVKGFSFWPAQVCKGDAIAHKKPRKLKNPCCVFFFGTHDYAWVAEDMMHPFEECKEKFNKTSKTMQFKNALQEIEKAMIEEGKGQKYAPGMPPVDSTSSAASANKNDAVFKNKKVAVSASPVQRDYSRTPFKKEKRNFESVAEPDTKKASTSPTKGSNVAEKVESEKKRVKISTPTKSNSVAPVNSTFSIHQSPSSSRIGTIHSMTEMKTINKSAKTKPSSLKFGFLGLGNIGQIVLKHLINTGHDLTIWNRTYTKCKEFEKSGVKLATTPEDVVRECDITFSCLSDATAASNLFFGNFGVFQEINATKGYVELTSLDFNTTMEIERAVKRKGGRYMEAPFLMCSTSQCIEDGKLISMVSGDRSLFDDCSSCFQAMCSHVYFLNENAGNAAKMNMALSAFYGNYVASIMECTTLVERLGLIQKDFVEIIGQSSLACPFITDKTQSLVDSTLIRDIPIDHIRRDLSYCLTMSNAKNFTTPITATANEVLKQKKHHYF